MSHHTWVNSVLIYPSTEAPRGSRGPGLWPFPYPSPAVDPIIRGLEWRAEPRCLLPSPLEQPMWKVFCFVCLLADWFGLVFASYSDPFLPCTTRSWECRLEKEFRGEKMLELQERFWEAEVLVWEGIEVSLLDASPSFPAPPWLRKQGSLSLQLRCIPCITILSGRECLAS